MVASNIQQWIAYKQPEAGDQHAPLARPLQLQPHKRLNSTHIMIVEQDVIFSRPTRLARMALAMFAISVFTDSVLDLALLPSCLWNSLF